MHMSTPAVHTCVHMHVYAPCLLTHKLCTHGVLCTPATHTCAHTRRCKVHLGMLNILRVRTGTPCTRNAQLTQSLCERTCTHSHMCTHLYPWMHKHLVPAQCTALTHARCSAHILALVHVEV